MCAATRRVPKKCSKSLIVFQRQKLLFPEPSASLAEVSTECVLSAVILITVTDIVRKDENVK